MKKTKVIIFFPVILAFALLSFTKPALNPIEKERKVLISTSYGDIKIRLYDETPLHRDNFIKLASEGYYDGTLFHRVINQFMIQGGDPDSKGAKSDAMLGNGGPAYTIPAEFISKYYHKKGVIAAAREGDNVNPNKASSGSQFYIVQGKKFTDAELDVITTRTGHAFTKEERDVYKTIGGAPHLDGSYTVFGEVYEGLDVVDKIAAVKTGFADRPVDDIKMTVKIIE
jgi:cyclophilin family peptidyl-prolyl cis-trans isomerase